MQEKYRVHLDDADQATDLHHNEGYDGHDIMEFLNNIGWKAISSWGRDGWDLGQWPYVILYSRSLGSGYQVITYCEGDTEGYQFPTKEERDAFIDEFAFEWWKWHEEDWVKGIDTCESAPDFLKGPFSWARANADEQKPSVD